jgi:xylulose-5-phosphate/fructose-6-phosphate phosphoketolase
MNRAHAEEDFRNRQIACRNYAYEHGIDGPDVTGWNWPYDSEVK